MAKSALIVIDPQNDYFPGGKFALWNTDKTLDNLLLAMQRAQAAGMPVILVQHVASSELAPFFVSGTTGVAVHPAILTAAPDAPVIVKHYADSFHVTALQQTLAQLQVEELLLCGMMTQNCVTHTALSETARAYASVKIVADCCTTVSEMLHLIALNAVAPRGLLCQLDEVLPE